VLILIFQARRTCDSTFCFVLLLLLLRGVRVAVLSPCEYEKNHYTNKSRLSDSPSLSFRFTLVSAWRAFLRCAKKASSEFTECMACFTFHFAFVCFISELIRYLLSIYFSINVGS